MQQFEDLGENEVGLNDGQSKWKLLGIEKFPIEQRRWADGQNIIGAVKKSMAKIYQVASKK